MGKQINQNKNKSYLTKSTCFRMSFVWFVDAVFPFGVPLIFLLQLLCCVLLSKAIPASSRMITQRSRGLGHRRVKSIALVKHDSISVEVELLEHWK